VPFALGAIVLIAMLSASKAEINEGYRRARPLARVCGTLTIAIILLFVLTWNYEN